jgi:hypothetical protein
LSTIQAYNRQLPECDYDSCLLDGGIVDKNRSGFLLLDIFEADNRQETLCNQEFCLSGDLIVDNNQLEFLLLTIFGEWK